MKIKIVSLLFIAAFSVFAIALTSDQQIFIAKKTKYFTSDKLNQIYVLSQDNSISKYDSKGAIVMSRNLKLEGDISSIDPQNVFSLLLFYKNINTIIFTDNLLNIRQKLDFNASEALADKQISAACRSFDNHIWVFDIISQKLIKINESGVPLFESSSLSAFTGQQHSPFQIIEKPPHVLLIDSTQLISLSIYGKYEKMLKSKNAIQSASIRQDTLWFSATKNLYLLPKLEENDSLTAYPISENIENVKYFEGGKLFLKADSLFLQRF